ncbi:MAG: tetratricopeptide repeat protein [Nannocystales bacterium]
MALPSQEAHQPDAEPGSSVGRYVVLEEVGRGGMGRVLRVYDPTLQREVALKEVLSDKLGSDGTAQLLAEARAMAKLSHPNVVAVYDVGEVHGNRVVLAMEFVPGATLKRWLRAESRPWQDVVEAFIAAGRGLAAAHGRGLLHRDFKPANVLVATDGAVKVTDFGLAISSVGTANPTRHGSEDLEQLEQPEHEDESQTRGLILVGTPRYMAPEQHALEDLTAAADQYAFCVALWEALNGRQPFRGRTLERDKRAGPPPWTNTGVPSAIVAAVHRGLSAAPADRFESMDALLRALSWDQDKRRRGWLRAGGVLASLGAIALGGGTWLSARAERCSGARSQLDEAWGEGRRAEVLGAMNAVGASYVPPIVARTEKELDDYAGRWAAMHTEVCEGTTVRGEQSSAVMDLRMACLHRAKTTLEASTAVLATADASVVQKAHRVTGGLLALDRCEDVTALAADVEPPNAGDAPAVEAARRELDAARAQRAAGQFDRAERSVAAAARGLEGIEYGPIVTELTLEQGLLLVGRGQYDAAEAKLREVVAMASRWQQWDELRASTVQLVFTVGYSQQKMEAGLRYYDIAAGLGMDDPRHAADAQANLAVILHSQGKFEEAEAEQHEVLTRRIAALGPEHPQVTSSRNNLAVIFDAQGKYEDAEAQYQQVIELRRKTLGPEHPALATTYNNLGAVWQVQGRLEKAEEAFRTSLALREKGFGPDHPSIGESLGNLGNILLHRARHEEAERLHRRALQIRIDSLGPEHPLVAQSLGNLSQVLIPQDKLDEAQTQQQRVLEILRASYGETHVEIALALSTLGQVHVAKGAFEDALVQLRASFAMRRGLVGDAHPDLADTHNQIGKALTGLGKSAEAEAEHRKALQILETAMGEQHPATLKTRGMLAEAREAQGKHEQAEPPRHEPLNDTAPRVVARETGH